MNENENTTTQNLWDTVKAVLRGKFIAIQAYLKKQEESQINNLTTPKATRRNEEPQGQQKERSLKNQDRNKCKRKETIAKINKAKSWFFEKINKIDKPLARLIKKKGRRIKSTKLEMKMERSQQATQKYKGS